CTGTSKRCYGNAYDGESVTLPSQAKVVIGGGGVIGTSIAYHLAKKGWTDVVLLEQGRLGCGTTWHSVGLVTVGKDDPNMMRLLKYSRELYNEFENEEDGGLGFKRVGSLEVAQSKDRMIALQKKFALLKVPSGCRMMVLLQPQMLCLHFPGKANSLVFEGVPIQRVLTKDDTVTGVETEFGTINCEYFVNCGGQPIPNMDPNLPVIRDPDGNCYFREWNGGLMAGGFEPPHHGGKPVFHSGIPPKFEFQLLPEDWDQFQVLLDGILNRMPLINEAQVRQLVNGPESFTPDQNWIIGESAEVYNYYVAAGMHSRGIQGAGGVGRLIAERMIDGITNFTNLWDCDIQRFVPHHSNRKFLRDRVKETIALYHLKYSSNSQFESGRNLRTSAIHTELKSYGAHFGETNAYERAMWFTPNYNEVKLEYQACKERVCLVDMSSFTKIEIKSKGPEALEFLQYMCSNNINQEIGTVIHTAMLNKHGGYENDCSIVPLRDNTFFLIAPTSQQTRCMFWLQKHLPKDGSVQVRDVTSMYSGLNLVGPHAQQLLSDVTETSTLKHDFKQMTCQYALHVYEMLMKAGKDYGIRNAGYLALRHLRIEKLFAYWGTDLHPHTTPLETGREFRVAYNSKDFIGKDALLKQKQHGISKKFVQVQMENFDIDSPIWPSGKEPIYRNGKVVGLTTSSAYGFTLGKFVCLGYIHHSDESGNPVNTTRIQEYIKERGAQYEIDVGGTLYPVTVHTHTPKMAYTASYKPTSFKHDHVNKITKPK
ncbi:PDPR-like protein, partial [Mya arenaria]